MPNENNQLNLTELRARAISELSIYSENNWTDFNVSDPGVVILEQLLISMDQIADFHARDIKELLAEEPGITQKNSGSYNIEQILTSRAVSLQDYTRLILDIPKVVAVEIEPIINELENRLWDKAKSTWTTIANENTITLPVLGQFRILVKSDSLDSEADRSLLLNRIRKTIAENRMLCEAFSQIILLDNQILKLKGDINLELGADVEEILAAISIKIFDFIQPRVDFSSLQNMIASGTSIDQIYTSPKLNNGFISGKELNEKQAIGEIHSSDLVHIIRDVKGVLLVQALNLSISADLNNLDWQPWAVKLSNSKGIVLESVVEAISNGRFLNCYKDGKQCEVDVERLSQLIESKSTSQQLSSWETLTLPRGEPVGLNYTSVQEGFPVVFGIGENELSRNESAERHSQAKQLQAYLLFFDQVLANYTTQLGNVGQLFSLSNRHSTTYLSDKFDFSQQKKIINLSGEDAKNDYWLQVNENLVDLETDLDRENRLLDHLISRFGEKFPDHSLLRHGKALFSWQEYIQKKRLFLSQISQLSKDRFKAGDFNTLDNRSGLEKRLFALLGFEQPKSVERLISDVKGTDEYVRKGFHLVEHSLLSVEQPPNTLYRDCSLSIEKLTNGRSLISFEVDKNALTKGQMITITGIAEVSGSYLINRVEPKSGQSNKDVIRIIVNRHFTTFNIDLAARWIKGSREADLYSMLISIIAPIDLEEFEDVNYRHYFESLVREEIPAHISLNIQWLAKDDFKTFEDSYFNWMGKKKAQLISSTNDLVDVDLAANQVMAFLF